MNSFRWLWRIDRSAYLSQEDWSFHWLAKLYQRSIELEVRARMGASFDPRAHINTTEISPDCDFVLIQLGAMHFLLQLEVDRFESYLENTINDIQAQAPNALILIPIPRT